MKGINNGEVSELIDCMDFGKLRNCNLLDETRLERSGWSFTSCRESLGG